MLEPTNIAFMLYALAGLAFLVTIVYLTGKTCDHIIAWHARINAVKEARLQARAEMRALDLCDEAAFMGLLVTQIPGYEEFAKRIWPTMYFDLW
jgi:hypothetical protein